MFNKKTEKISKHAETPELETNEKKKSRFGGIKLFFFIWNIVSITVYSAYTLYVLYNMTEATFLSKAMPFLLMLYALVFLILIILGLFDKKHMSSNLKNYKSAINFFKAFVQILNFVLSMITIVSVFIQTGKPDFTGFMFAILSLLLTLASIFFEIIKIIIRKNMGIIKQNFLEIHDKPKTRKKKEN